MRAAICLSFLLCVLPALSAEYRIRTPKGRCVLAVRVPGDVVVTTPNCHNHKTIFHVHGDVEPHSDADSYVSNGKWYIGKSKDGKSLAWVDKKYDWKFTHIHGSSYHTVHSHGDYWAHGHVGRPIKLGTDKDDWYFESA
ncbi:hypothetical protein APHAL10511_006903 [Amanita phalloides]|nr:hypothetical protein APHAL10511_006903 [Amanita phalloides]